MCLSFTRIRQRVEHKKELSPHPCEKQDELRHKRTQYNHNAREAVPNLTKVPNQAASPPTPFTSKEQQLQKKPSAYAPTTLDGLNESAGGWGDSDSLEKVVILESFSTVCIALQKTKPKLRRAPKELKRTSKPCLQNDAPNRATMPRTPP